MIIPAGKRRFQINQGGTQHESIFNGSFFRDVMGKTALGEPTFNEGQDVGVDPKPEMNDQQQKLQQTMNEGGLDPEIGMPEGADGVGQDRPQDQSQGGHGSMVMQQLVETLGDRPAAILIKFLEELQNAQMLPKNFMPDPSKTQFTIGGNTIQLRVQSINPGSKAVSYP